MRMLMFSAILRRSRDVRLHILPTELRRIYISGSKFNDQPGVNADESFHVLDLMEMDDTDFATLTELSHPVSASRRQIMTPSGKCASVETGQAVVMCHSSLGLV